MVNTVADSLSISPTPVKEAMNRLVAEGLMVMLPRRGFTGKATYHRRDTACHGLPYHDGNICGEICHSKF